ncbi:MAG: nicotinate (nicotinamide) nucleotide adenylyltransferase [Flavobacteriaceae bacterium]|nr:nicotinate (nicotinamide) nucleotide adenylyltransferase [Flavobacteriaceae bacterium]|tara:strand:- start:1313 stop:1894 length:582 start_codon:yes stop_codon:yes gene_type:complete
MKKGLFFGSFDPVHNGHLEVASYFIKNTHLSEIIFIVTPQNPFKLPRQDNDFDKRFKAVELATANNPMIKLSDVELKLPAPNYTCDTLEFIRTNNPKNEYVFLMGSDLLMNFEKWKNYQSILKNHNIYIYPRKNKKSIPKKFINHNKIKFFQAPFMEISSTYIRKKYSTGESNIGLVPSSVNDYIIKNNLYRL